MSVPVQLIERKIYEIRSHKVMLDRDLAILYGVETRVLNQAVRRNLERFPQDFMITLTREEIRNLSQIVISSDIKHAPSVFAFTEQGIAMLSSVLRSKRAIQVNIEIMRTFVKLKKEIYSHRELAYQLDLLKRRVGRHDNQIEAIFEAIQRLMTAPQNPRRRIGFNTV
ncbi:MAG: ORF6N domain-containing protein [Candidatus Omnitrophica bacterium]|nr:ORF6N domain-containing protein [Candidatus Omnitrophota bacterium]